MTLANLLKEQITRIAKRQVNAAVKPLKSNEQKLKTLVRSLKKEVAALRTACSCKSDAAPATTAAPGETPAARSWFTGKGVRAMRRKLKLTQAEMGKLCGVSSQSVILWERKNGKINLRKATFARLTELRTMKKAQVKAALSGENADA